MAREVPYPVAETFARLKKEIEGYLQLQYINGSWCVRKSTSKWNKNKNRPVKIQEHLGVIHLDGTFRKKISRNTISGRSTEIFEYGNCALAYHYLQDIVPILNDLTPYAQEILAFAIIKLIDSQPLKLVSSKWEKFYLSEDMRVSLSPKHISSVLHEVGTQISLWYKLFSELTMKDDIILYDMTKIFTHSENIQIAEKSWNSKHLFKKQIGIIMAFSSLNQLPIGIEVYPGSMKETKAIRDFRNRITQKNVGYIYDRGFTDFLLLDELREDNINYIIPLKKDSNYMDFRWVHWRGPFSYQDRNILWGRRTIDYGYTYFYDDPKIRGEQESALLDKVTKEKITLKDFEDRRKYAGIIGIVSDLDKNGEEIFDLYKGREAVEQAFDALNNAVDADKTYLQSQESVRGYYFVSFIALRIYFGILKHLKEKNLSKKFSVKEVLMELSKVVKIREKNGREYYAKIPKRAEKVMSFFPEIFGHIE